MFLCYQILAKKSLLISTFVIYTFNMEKSQELENTLNSLRAYFKDKQSVEMSFIFGSQIKGTANIESDFDIAVYFKPKTGRLEYEENIFYEDEPAIWNDLEKILKNKVDLVVLNRVPATLANAVLKNGRVITVKNKFRYLDFMLVVSSLAIDFREFVKDFRAIKARSPL